MNCKVEFTLSDIWTSSVFSGISIMEYSNGFSWAHWINARVTEAVVEYYKQDKSKRHI